MYSYPRAPLSVEVSGPEHLWSLTSHTRSPDPEISIPPPASVLEGFKGFVLWVGGALAGITALIYTCGYLVTRAHLSMLGLYGLVEFGNDHFLQEGAKFLISGGYAVLRTLLTLAAVVGVAAFVAMLIWLLLRRTAVGKWLVAWRERLSAPGGWLRYALFAALFVALVLHADHYILAFEQPLAVTNLLYADPAIASNETARPGTRAEIESWILTGAGAQLARHFEDLLFGLVTAAVLALLVWRITAPWHIRPWLTAPFMAALVLYVVTLPMAYGVLQRPVRYAVAAFTTEGTAAPGAGLQFLLSRTNDAFIVWDAASRRVVWIPAGSVKRAEIRGIEELFGRAPTPAQEKGGAK